MTKKLIAKGLGTFFLLTTVVGSNIMAVNLAQGNEALALLANTLATGATLVVIILSGAHFDPAVTLAQSLTHKFNGVSHADAPSLLRLS